MIWVVIIAFLISGTATLSKPSSQDSVSNIGVVFWGQYKRAYLEPLYYIGHLWYVGAVALFFIFFDISWVLVLMSTLAYLLLLISWSDVRHKKIPDLAVIAVIVLAAVRLFWGFGEDLMLSVAGAAALGVPTLLISFLNKDAIGLGDVKLLAALGLFFGLWDGLLLFILSLMLSAFVGLFMLAFKQAKRDTAIPFAPFLSVALVVLYYLYLI